MTDQPPAQTLADHLSLLEADAENVVAFLTVQHEKGGSIHPEALAKAARLQTSLRAVVEALTHHEHLRMSSDDVWAALTVTHDNTPGQIN